MNFDNDKCLGDGITFDDVLLVPAYSQVLPREVSLASKLTRNINLNVPILSAAMDTVTETDMAIAMAQEGGIGILHKNMSIEKQAAMVKKVKRAESAMIIEPITLTDKACVGDAISLMKEYQIGGIPIVNKNNKLVGIVTNRDLRFERNAKKPITEVMTKDRIITTTEFTNLEKAGLTLQKHKIEKLPVVDKNYRLIGLITYKDIMKIKSHPNACKDIHGSLRVGAAIGVTRDVLDRVAALVKSGVDVVSIDTAHGHQKGVIETAKKVKKNFPDLDLIVGNIGTAQAAKDLLKTGADAVKVGIGPGSICTTRIISGVGVPQLTAVYNVSQALKGTGVPVIADGGVRYTGDIVKAIAAGADSVMLGSMFAGVDESPGETIIYEGRKYKMYRGMGSVEAMKEGSKDRYFQDAEDDISKLVPEGIVGRVPYNGTLSEVAYQIIGGLRSGMGYCGAGNIEKLKEAKFIRMTAAGIQESHPHDVTITKEAPNYSR